MPWFSEAFNNEFRGVQGKADGDEIASFWINQTVTLETFCLTTVRTLFDTVEWARRIFSFSSMHSAKQTEKINKTPVTEYLKTESGSVQFLAKSWNFSKFFVRVTTLNRNIIKSFFNQTSQLSVNTFNRNLMFSGKLLHSGLSAVSKTAQHDS